eukprot:TRINITY_DN1743_c0_g1_i5.p1 TRINITY_DN1743_c0_g1~~TRINITY_DN1743_c0_g1_i5.p1  ORF type:complete len:735 (-),score=156.33 TRINITY_DN1743_c0_g1_i5:84-2288(-)
MELRSISDKELTALSNSIGYSCAKSSMQGRDFETRVSYFRNRLEKLITNKAHRESLIWGGSAILENLMSPGGDSAYAEIAAELIRYLRDLPLVTLSSKEEEEAWRYNHPDEDPTKVLRVFVRVDNDSPTKAHVAYVAPTIASKSVLGSESYVQDDYQVPPMLVKPRAYTSAFGSPFLIRSEPFLRLETDEIPQEFYTALRGADLSKVFEALTAIMQVPWTVNSEVYTLVHECWSRGEVIGSVPDRLDTPIPKFEESMTDEEYEEALKSRKKIMQRNAEMHSLRCSFAMQMKMAHKYLGRVFYFPYNLDFRGRMYPIPVGLNHMGGDISRALLEFHRKIPVGEEGIFWMKVHVANLYGYDKVPADDRAIWVEQNWPIIHKSIWDPFDGDRWWTEAGDPWQFISAARELDRIMNSENPVEYRSGHVCHQDGSCNGLQHYSALCRDTVGGGEVNLIPRDKPSDVYSVVMGLAKLRIRKDAEDGDLLAKKILKYVDRKTVKQTVMTSVYGVTHIGAKEQILRQLVDRDEIVFDDPIAKKEFLNKASNYLADITLQSIGDLFTTSSNVMIWLSAVAFSIVEREKVPMKWLTPLGLPCIQPYYDPIVEEDLVQTGLGAFYFDPPGKVYDGIPHLKRQGTAFPPNFIHSVDSTHMMMAARECALQGVDFAAVHDSYWSPPGNISRMSRVLRQEFVNLHSNPILNQLVMDLIERYPGQSFPPSEEPGDLVIESIMKSKFFFN